MSSEQELLLADETACCISSVVAGWRKEREGGVVAGRVEEKGEKLVGRAEESLEILSLKKDKNSEAREESEDECGRTGGDLRERRVLRVDHS